MEIYFYLLWYENNFTGFLYFRNFIDPTRDVNYNGKQNSEKIQRVNARHNSKANFVSLTISKNLLYFNFTKSR